MLVVSLDSIDVVKSRYTSSSLDRCCFWCSRGGVGSGHTAGTNEEAGGDRTSTCPRKARIHPSAHHKLLWVGGWVVVWGLQEALERGHRPDLECSLSPPSSPSTFPSLLDNI